MEEEIENQEMMNKPEDAGRGTDTQLAHLSLGEVVIPRAFLDDPQVMAVLQQMFEAAGADINEFTVGHEANKINPETGYPEFFFRRLRRIISAVAPIAVSFIPGVGPLAGAALGAGLGAVSGGGIKGALSGALSGYAGAGGGSILGKALGAGTGAASTGLGSALLGAGAGGISGGAKGALLGGALGGIGGYANAGGFDDLYKGSALQSAYSGSKLQDLYTGASGALDKVGSGVSDLYNGSALQDAFKSGSDALRATGINTNTSAVGSGVGASGGGGESPYGNVADGTYSPTADFNSYQLPTIGNTDNSGLFTNTASTANSAASALSPTQGATEVAKTNYASPIASALLGTFTNDKAEKQLLAQQRANQSLLAPYQNFEFNPDDLTQDPGYQFNLAQGNQALDRAQLARGGYFSGEALKEAQNFGQGLADNTYGNAFTRALQTNSAGLQAAGALAGVNEKIGDIRAGSTVNTGNIYSGALGSILGGDSFTNSGALQGGKGFDYLTRQQKLKLQQLLSEAA